MAYSRAPERLFLDVEELPAPMSLRQPVRYSGMRLAGSGRFCHLVDVNWHSGEILVYDDDDDAFARTPSLCLSLRPAAPALPSRTYAAETAMFVARGHSMTDPACRCCHGLSDERAHQLGVTPNSSRPGRCELKRQTSVKVTALDAELALIGPLDYVDASGVSLRRMLSLYLFDEATLRMPRIHDKEILLRMIDASAPLPTRLPHPVDSYVNIQRDAQALCASGRIRLLQGVEGLCAFAAGPELTVDRDIKALWHAQPPGP